MSTLLTARNLSKTYATHTLFRGLSLGLAQGDRLGLIGPNGSGKSTLVKILAGLVEPDEGEIICRRQLRIAYVRQDDVFLSDDTPLSAVLRTLDHAAHHAPLPVETRAEAVLTRLGFADVHQPVDTLSGGWRKRLSIACALANDPDVLILDEPTNHLDLDGVLWLEGFVRQAAQAVVFVTHDRVFLDRVANRIIELSRAYPDGLFEVRGNYSEFVRRKDAFLDAQTAQQTALAGKVRRDTAWLRQGIQGRQTRNKTQVADAQRRRDELQQLVSRNKAPRQTTAIDFQATERKTNKLLLVHNVSKAMGDRVLFKGVNLKLSPGMCLGLLGPNGSGKTTLLKLLSGDLSPDTGTVKPAPGLRIVNFSQHREDLNPTLSLREALCPVGDRVEYRGKPVHVAGWAQKFLFDPSKFNVSVGDLSGGEQARVLIANLMLRPADVLILDEPTNDLDIPSLEVLEQALLEFPGAVVIVTHDRFMLQRLATDLIALDGQGGVRYFHSYQQWQDSRRAEPNGKRGGTEQPKKDAPSTTTSREPAKTTGSDSRKLTYKLQRELDMMEQVIQQAESDCEQLQAQAADPEVIADRARHEEVCHRLSEAQAKVDQLYARWQELETMRSGS